MNITDYIDLCPEAYEVYRDTLNAVGENSEFKNLGKMIADGAPFGEIAKNCADTAEKLGTDKYALNMTVLFANLNIAVERWGKSGTDMRIFKDTAEDFLYKIAECKKVYGVWGIEPFAWYEHLFNARLFKLGRLQFQPQGEDIYIHIPSCGPLDHGGVIGSYKKAFGFFGKKHGDVLTLHCGSYLLFPSYKGTAFAEGTNIYSFVDDFEVLNVNYTDGFNDAWRIFGCAYDGDSAKLPAETSMQKAFVSYINNGGKFGTALGVLRFDGEKVVRRKERNI